MNDLPDWEPLNRRREEYPIGVVPAGAVILTAGVDVGQDRLEVEVVGWGAPHAGDQGEDPER